MARGVIHSPSTTAHFLLPPLSLHRAPYLVAVSLIFPCHHNHRWSPVQGAVQRDRQGQSACGFGVGHVHDTHTLTWQPLQGSHCGCSGRGLLGSGRLHGHEGHQHMQGRGQVDSQPTPPAAAAPCGSGPRRRQPTCQPCPPRPASQAHCLKPGTPEKTTPAALAPCQPANNQTFRPASLAPAGQQARQPCAPRPAPPGSLSSKRQVAQPPMLRNCTQPTRPLTAAATFAGGVDGPETPRCTKQPRSVPKPKHFAFCADPSSLGAGLKGPHCRPLDRGCDKVKVPHQRSVYPTSTAR